MSAAEPVGAQPGADDGAGGLLSRLKSFEGQAAGPPRPAPDEVNQAMIRHMVEAVGDDNPVYVDPDAAARSVHGRVIAPPTMLQVWTMRGLRPTRSDGGGDGDGDPDPLGRMHSMLDEAGFTGVVATDCLQTYHRDVRLGDRLSAVTTIESVSPEKKTGLGVGHFVTTVTRVLDADGEPVGEMMFRVLKFKPGTGRSPEPASEAR